MRVKTPSILVPVLSICMVLFAQCEGLGQPVTGTVMSVAGEDPQYLSIISGNAFFSAKNLRPTSDCVRSGDRVAVTKDRIQVLGRGMLPETQQTDARSIADGRFHRAYVNVSGVIRSVIKDELDDNYQWLVLSTPNGIVYAAVTEYDYPPDRLLELRDKAVEIRGRVARFLRWRNFLRYHLLVYGTDGIRPLASEPDGFSGLHRQTFRGQVLGCGTGRLFITSDDGEFLPVKFISEPPSAEPGCYVSVVGFVELGPNGRQLVEATLQEMSGPPTPLPPPREITAKDLRESYGQIVRLRGSVTGFRSSILLGDLVILSCEGQPVAIDTAGIGDEVRSDLEPGCVIDVTGVCFAQFTSEAGANPFPTFGGFTLIPRTVRDIRILSRPPWWTPGKFLCVIALLLVALCILTVRNRLRIRTARMRAEARTEERTHLAVELHDTLSQNLTGITLELQSARERLVHSPEQADARLALAGKSLDSCRRDLRNCLRDLRSNALEKTDMNEAIRMTLEPHVGNTHVAIRFNVPRERLTDNAAHTILRIVRELVLNALRHGQATEVRVAGAIENDRLLFSVRDNGRGFDPANRPGAREGHFGLLGVRERVAAFAGKLQIDSAPGRGAHVSVSINLPRDTDATT